MNKKYTNNTMTPKEYRSKKARKKEELKKRKKK